MDVKQEIRKYALENAVKYEGKANHGSIVSKMINVSPELKKDIKSLMKEISLIVGAVNKMKLADQTAELMKIAPELLEHKKEEKEHELKELKNVDSKKGVIMRFAPSPSGPMHLGHAITGGLTSLYVKKYGGKFILRIEDTNSDNIDLESYKLLPEDGNWIFGNISEVWIQSDRMKIYYEYAEKMINLGVCYVCTCSQEAFKKHADMMEDCPCRNGSVTENIKRWKKMFKGYKEGEAVMRFKAGMQLPNPAMRDFPLVRINDSEHPRQGKKYRVWPLMNLCVTVDDIEAGMTHIIRAKDHADNAKRQEMMYRALGISKLPETYFLGRYNFDGLEISCSKTKARIKSGEFSGWDDIRLPFLQALKRRGYQPGAFLKYTQMVGLSPVDKTVPAEEFFKTLNALNKELIDSQAKRFFFVYDYETVVIEGAPKQELKLALHPENKHWGFRGLKTNEKFLIQKKDIEEVKTGKLYRLMDCLNFTKNGKKLKFASRDYADYKGKGEKTMHFLPAEGNIDAEILMDDGKTLKGMAEEGITMLKQDDIIQFERFGFVRLDCITETDGKLLYKFWFTHR